MRILITGVGGPTPRSFALSLKLYSKLNCEITGVDANPLSIGLYRKDIFKNTYVVPKASEGDYWSVLESIIRENNIEYAVILPEAEVQVWSERATVKELPCKVLLPDAKIAAALVDKSLMTDLLEPLSVVPTSVTFSRDQSDLGLLLSKLEFPFWVRSSAGTSGLGSLKVQDERTLRNWIDINPGVKKFLASSFLPGRNLACKLLYWKGNLIRSACGERVNYIMSKVAPSGITGNTSFGRLLNEPAIVRLAIDTMTHLFENLNAEPHGFFTIDLKEDENGTPYITEINVRHVAFTQCFAAAGANFASDTMRLLSDDPSFEKKYHMYTFEPGTIFLRDVDGPPIIMKESDLLKYTN